MASGVGSPRKPRGLAVTLLVAAGAAIFAGLSFTLAPVWRGGRRNSLYGATRRQVQVDGDLQPLLSYLLVKPKEAITETKSGLLLATAKEKPSEGEVLSVGPGEVHKETGVRVPAWAQVGMKILHGKYGVEEVNYKGEDHVLVRDDEVLLSYTGDEPTLESIKMPRGKVLIKLLEESEETAGGILLSKGAVKSDTTMGEVVAVGDDDLDKHGNVVPLEISVGDTVRFRYGNEVKLDLGKSEFRSVEARECLAKWSK